MHKMIKAAITVVRSEHRIFVDENENEKTTN